MNRLDNNFIVQSKANNEPDWHDEVSFKEDERDAVITFARHLADRYADESCEVRVIMQKTFELFRLTTHKSDNRTNEDRWGNGKYDLD